MRQAAVADVNAGGITLGLVPRDGVIERVRQVDPAIAVIDGDVLGDSVVIGTKDRDAAKTIAVGGIGSDGIGEGIAADEDAGIAILACGVAGDLGRRAAVVNQHAEGAVLVEGIARDREAGAEVGDDARKPILCGNEMVDGAIDSVPEVDPDREAANRAVVDTDIGLAIDGNADGVFDQLLRGCGRQGRDRRCWRGSRWRARHTRGL